MIKFMKQLNNISRSQAIYRHSRITADDLQSYHYAYVLTISHAPGRTQDEIADDLCVNKSTVTRNLNYLEQRGYIERQPLANDKRCLCIHPTKKMLAVLPEIRQASAEWSQRLSEGISEQELAVFQSVLTRMQEKAKAIIGGADSLK